MTPEQKQQLEQVREQQAAHSALFDAHDSYKIVRRSEIRTMLNSIDFLLSLVKSQGAEIELLRRASADPEDKQYGATVYDGNGNYSLLAQNAINRNVNEMRSACVEEVRAIAESWAVLASVAKENDAAYYGGKVDAAHQIGEALKTLSIEQPKE